MDTLEVAYVRRPIANTNLRWLLGRFSRFRIRSSPHFWTLFWRILRWLAAAHLREDEVVVNFFLGKSLCDSAYLAYKFYSILVHLCHEYLCCCSSILMDLEHRYCGRICLKNWEPFEWSGLVMADRCGSWKVSREWGGWGSVRLIELKGVSGRKQPLFRLDWRVVHESHYGQTQGGYALLSYWIGVLSAVRNF